MGDFRKTGNYLRIFPALSTILLEKEDIHMEKVLAVAQVIVPILVAIFLGMLSRKKEMLTQAEAKGLQQFVLKFGLPCVVFNSCLTAQIGLESLSSMVLVLLALFLSSLWSFRAGKKLFPYHNLPMLFSAQESGMIGIPLYLILFGRAEAYRIGVLDVTQAILAFPVIALLAANVGENPAPGQIVKKMLTSPLLVMSFLGLALNFSGGAQWLNEIGIGALITESTGLLAQPVSVLMIFSIGYNFSMDRKNRGVILKISAIHLAYFMLACALIQAVLFLLPEVDAMTRWAVLLFCALPSSYLAPGLGRTEEEYTIASGVCSLLTVVCLVVFCIIAAIVAV